MNYQVPQSFPQEASVGVDVIFKIPFKILDGSSRIAATLLASAIILGIVVGAGDATCSQLVFLKILSDLNDRDNGFIPPPLLVHSLSIIFLLLFPLIELELST